MMRNPIVYLGSSLGTATQITSFTADTLQGVPPFTTNFSGLLTVASPFGSLPGKTVSIQIYANGTWNDTGVETTTDAQGLFRVAVSWDPKTMTPGTYQIRAYFPGDATYSACASYQTITITVVQIAYPNALPLVTNPASFNPMDDTTWATPTHTYRYAVFFSGKTSKEMDSYTLGLSGKTIADIVNDVEQQALNQGPTILVNTALQQGYQLNIIGVAADAGYEITRTTPSRYGTITYYKIWYAVYLVYDSNNNLQATPSQTTLGAQAFLGPLLTFVAIVIAGLVAAFIAYEAIQAIQAWLQSMTTTTSQTTTTTYTYNPDGTVATKTTTTTNTTQPNLGGIITVGAVAIGLAGAGVFLYLLLKGSRKGSK